MSSTCARILAASLLAMSCLSAPIVAASTPIDITVTDLTAKFLNFYEKARQPGVSEEQRWRLWKQMVDFAAVPPTPEGRQMARKMLDDAWTRYPAVLPMIRQGVGAIKPPPREILQSVADLLQSDVPIKMNLVVFVGNFDNNAFTAPGKDAVPTVAVPVEAPHKDRLLTHEFTHVVEAEQAGLTLDWRRSIAHTIFAEGLAMRATQKLLPGLPTTDYVGETSPGWFAKAQARQEAIIKDIIPHLNASDSDTVMRYTMGIGGAGVDREAYYAGWIVLGDLLSQGWTFPKLCRVKEEQMAPLVRETLKRLSEEQR